MNKRKVFGESDESGAESDTEGGFFNDMEQPNDSEEEVEAEDEQLLASSDSDSDDAPDDVSLEQSRAAALRQVQGALEQIRQVKGQERERRRDHQLRNIQQKKEKLAALAKCRLPEELLEDLPESPAHTKVEYKTNKRLKIHSESADELEEQQGDEGVHSNEEEYITLDKESTAIKPVYLGDIDKKMTSVEKAQAFRDQQLYGKKVVRESTKDMLAKQIKRKARFK